MQVKTIGLKDCLERVIERSGYRDEARQVANGRGIGIAGSAYISGAGLPIYWNAMPHSGVQVKVDRGRRRGRLLRLHGHRPGIGLDPRLHRGRGARHPARGHPRRHRRHRPHPRRPRLVLLARDAHDRQCGDPGRAQGARVRSSAPPRGSWTCPWTGSSPATGASATARTPTRGLTFPEAVVLAEAEYGTLGAVGSYRPPRSVAKWKGAGVGPTPTYSYSAAAVEVCASIARAGIIRVDKVWIAHDIGRSINPLLVVGQVEGSVYMALGEILMEEQVFRKGRHKIPSMLDYKSPTTLEMPPVESILVETLDPEGPYGAKEVGQGPLLPVIPAVANAVLDAVGRAHRRGAAHPGEAAGRARGTLSAADDAGLHLSGDGDRASARDRGPGDAARRRSRAAALTPRC